MQLKIFCNNFFPSFKILKLGLYPSKNHFKNLLNATLKMFYLSAIFIIHIHLNVTLESRIKKKCS